MRRLLTAREVAKVLGCNYRHVHTLRKRGALKAVDIAANTPEAEISRQTGTYRFTQDDVEAYIDGQKVAA